MISSSNNQTLSVERAQPWLGTLVSIQVEGLSEREAHLVIDAAFQGITTVHQVMSFHSPTSELSRLNQTGSIHAIEVHPYTYEVLQQAIHLSAETDGCFDVTVGAELVRWKLLPQPAGTQEIRQGSWRDIELLPGNRVFFHRPLCVDLGGIAKGFAVDLATECLLEHGATRAVVNAGGDIRVAGEAPEVIRLAAEATEDRVPVLELTNGSVAASSGHIQRRWHQGQAVGPHVNGIGRSPASTDRFVCVVAERCTRADALTKVVMARGAESAPLLQRFHASAYLHDPGQGWLALMTNDTKSIGTA